MSLNHSTSCERWVSPSHPHHPHQKFVMLYPCILISTCSLHILISHLRSCRNTRMTPEQAKKNFERAMRLEHEFKHYFTGTELFPPPNLSISIYISPPFKNNVFVYCKSMIMLVFSSLKGPRYSSWHESFTFSLMSHPLLTWVTSHLSACVSVEPGRPYDNIYGEVKEIISTHSQPNCWVTSKEKI